MKKLIYIFICLLGFQAATGQKRLDEKQRQQLIERIIENKEGGADYTDLQDQLDMYLQNPLDLNTCQPEQLRQLSILNEWQIESIIAHRKRYGFFLAVEELQVIDAITPDVLINLLPFVTVEQNNNGIPSFKKMIQNASQDFINLYQRQLQTNEGQRRRLEHDTIDKPYYLGNSLRSVIRYKMSYKNLFAIGFTGEKDAGEQFMRGSNKQGFDFNSAYLYIGERKYIKKLVIGDFNLMLGQGLTFGSGLSFGKSAMVMNVKRNNNGIRPYRSVNENEFLRGVGTTIRVKKMTITAFASRKKVDGNLSGDTLAGEDESFSSIISSGNHRTQAEIEDKHTITQTLAGGRIGYQFKKLEIGVSTAYIHFSQPLLKDIKPYNQFSFSGTTDQKTGIDYTFSYRNMMFFGETSKNHQGGFATINALLISLSQRLDYITVYRKYDRDFKPVLSNGWGENSQNENEEGWYNGFAARLGKGFSMTGYYDYNKSAWLRYKVNEPNTMGHDALLELDYIPSKTVSAYIRYRTETKPYTSSSSDYFKELENYRRQSVRTNIQVKLSRTLQLKSRLEISTWSADNNSPQKGFLVYQDVDWKNDKGSLNISGRVTMFNIDGFNARIYTYEDDMIYTFSVPMFLNRGMRVYLLTKYRISKRVDLWIKIAQTQYQNISTIGSGLDLINSAGKTDVKAQVRIALGKR